ncbi:hypothetical protein DL89DRAFT_225403, partial [Linderina pennispora]
LTLDQIRRLRTHMLRVTREQDLELSTAALGWVYFEKLIWKGYVVKDNRKLIAGKMQWHILYCCLSDTIELSILDQEFDVFAQLEFSLWVPRHEFMPHFARMFEAIGLYRSYEDYLGNIEFYACKLHA